MPPFLATTAPLSESQVTWYVAYTDARQEAYAAMNLQQQGFLTYLPLYKTYKKPAKVGATRGMAAASAVYDPMFPRYLFFRPSNSKQSISCVRSTRGVNAIIRFGASYALVQPEILKSIQEHEQQRNQEDVRAINPFQPGRRVRLSNPALDGLEGLVQSASTQRVIVLMEILGRQAKLKLSPNEVELV
ncbi:transcription termination/antitermination NusG family protein [Pollutimonas bauzanensis]|jgi:transcriptional antiterminator RfaH|uniref:transcription termination/antitermination protein NusG n=1 Tax=Pollutimonas bauzanensis TaxID=658167 RepID=UPI00333E8064